MRISLALPCLVALAACGGNETAPPLGNRDGGRDMTVADASTDAEPADASVDADAVDAEVDAGPPRNLVDFELTGEGFTDQEALTVFARLEDRTSGYFSEVGSAVVASGAFTISMPDAFDADLFGMQLYVYVDLDMNSVCDAETDTLYQVSVPRTEGSATESYYFESGAPAIEAGTCDVF